MSRISWYHLRFWNVENKLNGPLCGDLSVSIIYMWKSEFFLDLEFCSNLGLYIRTLEVEIILKFQTTYAPLWLNFVLFSIKNHIFSVNCQVFTFPHMPKNFFGKVFIWNSYQSQTTFVKMWKSFRPICFWRLLIYPLLEILIIRKEEEKYLNTLQCFENNV